MEINLEKAAISDVEEIHKMQVKAFLPLLEKYQDYDTNPASEPSEKIKWRMEMENSWYYFIMAGKEKIGAVRIRKKDEWYSLSPISILPEYQGKGYGQQAIVAAETLYPEAKRWRLDTIKQEEKLLHLYRKMGYCLTGEERIVNERTTLVDLEKII